MNSKKLLLALLVPLMLSLTACQTAPSRLSVCPKVIEYTKQEQKEAAKEIKATPPGPYVSRFVIDYKTTRDQLRKCQ